MFPVTVTIHNTHQMHAVMAALQAIDSEPRTGGAIQGRPDPRNATTAKEGTDAGKPGATTASTKPGAAAETTKAADALAKKDAESAAKLGVDDKPAEVTYDHVKTLILEVSKQKGREAALKLLGEFGAEKGPDLQKTPEKFGPFVTRAKALLA
jgi:hypothetical protein